MCIRDSSSASLATCLRTCSPPTVSYVKPFSHTRHITPTALLNALQPFLSAAAQRAALVAWLAAVTDTAACGNAQHTASRSPPGPSGPGPTGAASPIFVMLLQRLQSCHSVTATLHVVGEKHEWFWRASENSSQQIPILPQLAEPCSSVQSAQGLHRGGVMQYALGAYRTAGPCPFPLLVRFFQRIQNDVKFDTICGSSHVR